MLFYVFTKKITCPTGSFRINWNQTGPTGQSAEVTVSAVFTLTNRDDSGGNQEFFADSPDPTVPSVLSYSGDNPVGTSSWYTLFFPNGTNFGLAPATSAGQPWTSWSWSYDAPNTCETWTDAYNNNGGQSLTAGNIAGVNQCTA